MIIKSHPFPNKFSRFIALGPNSKMITGYINGKEGLSFHVLISCLHLITDKVLGHLVNIVISNKLTWLKSYNYTP